MDDTEKLIILVPIGGSVHQDQENSIAHGCSLVYVSGQVHIGKPKVSKSSLSVSTTFLKLHSIWFLLEVYSRSAAEMQSYLW